MRKALHFPFPSVSSVNRFVRKIFCSPGVQIQAINKLVYCLKDANIFQRNFVLLIDEMSIEQGVIYSHQFKRIFGYPTIKPTNETYSASHLLLVIIRGLTSRIKCIVGWHLTGSSTDRSANKKFVLECIQELSKQGIKIFSIISDMGCQNQGLFADLGLNVSANISINQKTAN